MHIIFSGHEQYYYLHVLPLKLWQSVKCEKVGRYNQSIRQWVFLISEKTVFIPSISIFLWNIIHAFSLRSFLTQDIDII